MAKEKDTRCRNWTFLVYLDSAPENWMQILDDTHVEWIRSPYHEHDLNADGSPKKPHYHILVLFGGVKSFEQVCEFIKPLNGPIPERCHNSRAMVRYFAHLDNPDKHRYSISEIIGHGGVDVSELLKPSHSERYTIIKEICEFVADSSITEFFEIMDYAMEHRFDSWFPLLCDSGAYIVNQYIKSNRQRLYQMRQEGDL